jgi:hypothetical protein
MTVSFMTGSKPLASIPDRPALPEYAVDELPEYISRMFEHPVVAITRRPIKASVLI